MQRIFLTVATAIAFTIAAAAALAADMPRPVYKAPPPEPAVFSWTGFYLGLHAGGAWSSWDWFYPCTAPNLLLPPCGVAQGGHSAASWLAGGQAGFNYQMGQWVLGLEAELSATRIKGDHVDTAFPNDTHQSRTDFIATVAPRLGVAWDRALLYAKGGAAWAHTDYALAVTSSGLATYTPDVMRFGWMAGLGVEYALAPSWSAKLEYDYLDLGTARILYASNGALPGLLSFDEDIRQRIQIVKVGLNYKFDWGWQGGGRY